MEDVNQAIKFKPNYAQAYQLKGMIHHENLRKEIQKLQSNPNLTQPEQSEKIVKIIQDYIPQAIADHDKAIEIAPKFGVAYFQRGGLRFALAFVSNEKQELLPNSLKDYNKAIKLMNDPTPEIYHLWLGVLPEELEDFSSHQLKEMFVPDASLYALVYKSRGYLF